MGDGERVDGEMVYQDEDDKTVNSEMTNSVTGCTPKGYPGMTTSAP